LARAVVDAGFKVHKTLGPDLLETVYELCLARELELRGLVVMRQVSLPVVYEGLEIDGAFRIDLLVNDALIVEVKAVDALARVHEAQLLTYLKFEPEAGVADQLQRRAVQAGRAAVRPLTWCPWCLGVLVFQIGISSTPDAR